MERTSLAVQLGHPQLSSNPRHAEAASQQSNSQNLEVIVGKAVDVIPFGCGKPLETFNGRPWIVESSSIENLNCLENGKGLTVSRAGTK